MPIDHSLVGKSSEPQTFEVTEEAVKRFMEATEDPALQSGEPLHYAPPTFPTTFRTRIPGLELDGNKMQLLHGEQEYHYTRRLRIGEQVTCVVRIVDVRQKAGRTGSMTFITSETTGTDSEQQPVYTARSISIVREK
ncbi:MAG TPA: MaoC family dehydratase N-terminal domain-containing protein [Ktedonobacteraceae bacterium]|nr:MaoC family dehydratase N-terminal domain-containing protein [Ktedonobacteraceae bacterium]